MLIRLAMPLGHAQLWFANRVRDARWYSPLALMGWGLTRPPFAAMYRLAVRLNG